MPKGGFGLSLFQQGCVGGKRSLRHFTSNLSNCARCYVDMPQSYVMSHDTTGHSLPLAGATSVWMGKYGRPVILCRQSRILVTAEKKWANLQPLFMTLAVSQYTTQPIHNQFSYLEVDRRARLSSHLPSPTVTNICVAVLLIKHSWWTM